MLIGPWPEAEDIYRARSPINFVDLLSTPMLVLQGADDHVVPPAQAEVIVEALARKGIPHAYLLFDGEGHGFRKAETIVSARTRGAVVLRADPGVRARGRRARAADRESALAGRAQPPIALIERAGWTKSAWFTR